MKLSSSRVLFALAVLLLCCAGSHTTYAATVYQQITQYLDSSCSSSNACNTNACVISTQYVLLPSASSVNDPQCGDGSCIASGAGYQSSVCVTSLPSINTQSAFVTVNYTSTCFGDISTAVFRYQNCYGPITASDGSSTYQRYSCTPGGSATLGIFRDAMCSFAVVTTPIGTTGNCTANTLQLKQCNPLAPVVTSLSSVPTQGGQTIISGSNFGSNLNVLSVSIGGQPCTGLRFVSGYAQLQCFVAPGTGANLTAVVQLYTVSGSASFSYGAPKINYRSQAPTIGGMISINGSNFGRDPSVIAVSVDGQPCTDVSILINDYSILCNAPPGTGSNSILEVDVNGQYDTESFTYQIPKITSVTTVPTTGGTVTITGSNFGPNSTLISVLIGYNNCTNPQLVTSDSVITCTLGAGVGANLPVQVTVDGRVSYRNVMFAYPAPKVSAASTSCSTGGILYINGSSFGTNPNLIRVSLPYGISCPSVNLIVNQTYLSCNLPNVRNLITGSISQLHVNVTVASQNSDDGNTAFSFYPLLNYTYSETATTCPNSYDGSVNVNFVSGVAPFYVWQPQYTSASLLQGACVGGGVGASFTTFNLTSGGMSVDFCLYLCSEVYMSQYAGLLNGITCSCGPSGWRAFQSFAASGCNVTCQGNPAQKCGGKARYTIYSTSRADSVLTQLTGGSQSVFVADQCETDQVNTVVPGPAQYQVTANVKPPSCYLGSDGTISLQISGGTGPYNYFWQYRGSTATTLSSLPTGNYSVYLTDSVGCRSPNYTINVPQPTPLQLSVLGVGNSSTPTSQDGSVSISVSGGTPPYSYSWSPSGSRSGNLTTANQGLQTVTVTDANGCSNSTSAFVDSVPHATSLTLPPTGGGTITIYGANFGTNVSDITVLINGIPCTNVQIVTANSVISCNAPAGSGPGNHLNIIVGSKGEYTYNPIFNYQSPNVTSTTSACQSGSSVVILGNNFGTNAAQINVTVGTIPCTGVTILEPNTAIGCLVPAGQSSARLHVAVTVNGLTNTDGNDAFSYFGLPAAPISASLSGTSTTYTQNNGVIRATVTGGTPPYSYAWFNINELASYVACLTTGTGSTVLTGSVLVDKLGLTPEKCIRTCSLGGYFYSGVQNGTACYCGYSFPGSATVGTCNSPCSGSSSTTCGGQSSMQVYLLRVTSQNAICRPFDNLEVGPYYANGLMTLSLCQNICGVRGYLYAAASGSSCYCGSNVNLGSTTLSPLNCNFICAGDSTQSCGGNGYVSVAPTGYGILIGSNSVIGNLSYGAYNFFVFDQCSQNANVTIQLIDVSASNVSCNGEDTAQVTVLVPPPSLFGANSTTYKLSATGGNSSSFTPETSTKPYFSSLGANQYTLTAQSGNSQPVLTTFTIAQPNAFQVTFSPANVVTGVSGGVAPYVIYKSIDVETGETLVTVTDSEGCSVTKVLEQGHNTTASPVNDATRFNSMATQHIVWLLLGSLLLLM